MRIYQVKYEGVNRKYEVCICSKLSAAILQVGKCLANLEDELDDVMVYVYDLDFSSQTLELSSEFYGFSILDKERVENWYEW